MSPDSTLLAPTGTLRAVINVGNAVLAGRRPDGEPFGVSVDLASDLARRLGVPVRFEVVDGAAKSVEAVAAGRVDVGFFAIDPARATAVSFTAPYVLIEGSYLVREDSPIRSNDEVDRAGRTIAVATGSAYDLFLSRELKAASIVREATSQGVVDGFVARGLDVAAGVRQQLEADLLRLPGLRMLPGRFMVIRQAMGTPTAYGPAAIAALRAFVEDAKRSGFVAEALSRHGIQGASVAQPED